MKTQSNNLGILIASAVILISGVSLLYAKDRPAGGSERSEPASPPPAQRAAPAERPVSAPPARTESRPAPEPAPAQPAPAPSRPAESRPAPQAAPTPAPQARPAPSSSASAPQARPAAPAAAPSPAPQRQTAVRSRPVNPTVGVSRNGQISWSSSSSSSQRTVESRTAASAAPRTATRDSVVTPVGAGDSQARTQRPSSVTSARTTTAPAETRTQPAAIKPDSVVESISVRENKKPDVITEPAAIATKDQIAQSNSSSGGIDYYGKAYYERNRKPVDLTARSQDSITSRQKTDTPKRVTAEDITVKTERVTADDIKVQPQRVNVNAARTTTPVEKNNVARSTDTSEASKAVTRITVPERTNQAASAKRDIENRNEPAASQPKPAVSADQISSPTIKSRPDSDPRSSNAIVPDKNNTPLRNTLSQSHQPDNQRQPIVRSNAAAPDTGGLNAHPGGRPDNYSSKVVINGNNNIVVQGNVTTANPRPYIPHQLCHDRDYFHHDSHWVSHSGLYFEFTWSNLSCGRIVAVPYHNYFGLTYYYPGYHRKYLYVSIGSYWPECYRPIRYYWYGCHPYYWYGSYAVPTPVYETSSTYNTYNTYNYYNNDAPAQPQTYAVMTPAEEITTRQATYMTSEELAKAREAIEADKQKADAPEYVSTADMCFDHAVKIFAAGNYADASEQFREAVKMSPDDVILPFTYSQALFAAGNYAHAAGVLREALAKIPADKPTIYYPRGLYTKDEVLHQQIEQLKLAIDKEPFDSDYQLLLGYQYLGLGELDKAARPLSEAASSPANAEAAGKLIDLAAKLEQEKAAAVK